jgi:hypothetical protein
MNNEKSSLSISQDLQIMSPKKEDAYPIPDSDWNYLQAKVSKIASPDLIYHTIGSILFGVAGSAFIALLTLPEEIEIIGKLFYILWAIFATAFICGGLCFFFSYHKRKYITCSKEDVLDEMNRLVKKYRSRINNS